MSSQPRRASIAIIGAGPRGTSLIERIGALLPQGVSLDLHIIDDAPPGSGRIWRTDQDRELCMNTLADAVTLFTEPGASVTGPVREGPTLYEWCLLAFAADPEAGIPGAADSGTTPPGTAALVVGPDPDRPARLAAIPRSHRAAFDAFPPRPGLAVDYGVELAALRPESHPSRALYGEYLAWCFDRAVALLPKGVRAIQHRGRAVGVAHDEGAASETVPSETVSLADGSAVLADAVIIATGWMPRTPTEAERGIEQHLAAHPSFVWVRPGSPAEQRLDFVPDGARAIVRGLGMGFFDAAALLTIGRGGRFAADPTAPGGLRYEASGREPRLHVTSRRGVPFRAKTLYGSLPPRTEQRFLRSVDWSAAPRPIDFDRAVWPRVVADAYTDFVTTLHRVRPEAVPGGLPDALAAIEHGLEDVLSASATGAPGSRSDAALADLNLAPARMNAALEPLIPNPADRFDLLAEMHPARGPFPNAAAFDAWVRSRVADDLREAELGRDSAVKAGLWSVSTARGAVSRIGTMGGFDAESRGNGYRTVMAVGALAGSGPPAFRNRQLLALAEAGIVRFIGPGARLVLDDRGFTTMSPAVADAEVSAPVLVDAWMHFHDVSATADPLARSLLDAGRARPFAVRARDGREVATAAFDVRAEDGRIVRADGTPDPAVHIAGIPVDDALHDTIISPMPGTDPPMLRETDRVAGSAIRTALAAARIEGAQHD
ncbi:hypothetical protein D3248_02535 [Leucobacter zeae]|nr:hypothetical protein [Leucobacter zeae]